MRIITWASATVAVAGFSATIPESKPQGTLLDDNVVTPTPFIAKPAAGSEVELELDLSAEVFSAQNAYYMAAMSKLVYSDKNEVKGMLIGNETSAGIGFDRFHWFEADPVVSGKSILDSIQDTEAFVAANDDLILLAFRGTKEPTDWATNIKIGLRSPPAEWKISHEGCDLHQGFDDGVDTVWLPSSADGMYQTIMTLYNEEGKNRKLFITGHSLGAALATIAAARLVFVDDVNIAGMYTIGSPRVFNKKLAREFDAKVNHGAKMKSKYFRMRNNNDIIPRVPPPPFEHVGTEVYFDRFGAISTTSIRDRFLGVLGALSRGSFDGIKDHSSSEYVRLLKQTVIGSRRPLFEKTKNIFVDTVQKDIPINTEEHQAQMKGIDEAKRSAPETSKATSEPAVDRDADFLDL